MFQKTKPRRNKDEKRSHWQLKITKKKKKIMHQLLLLPFPKSQSRMVKRKKKKNGKEIIGKI